MTSKTEKFVIGAQLKELRTRVGLTQAELASRLGVSASYVTLLEANQRPASVALLMKLSSTFDINIIELAPDRHAQLISDVIVAMKDPRISNVSIGRAEAEKVVQASPETARAMVRMHKSHWSNLVSSGGQDHGPAPTAIGPVETVQNWFYQRNNYFDEIDRAAETQALGLSLLRTEPDLALSQQLASHGVRIRVLPATIMKDRLRWYDIHAKELQLSELLGQPSRRFQMAVLLARLEQETRITQEVQSAKFQDGLAKTLATVSLYNYFAAALLMPYAAFLNECETNRYDIELLSHRFGTTYEQTAHRMATLQRPEARGIPFFFVRVDRAGNISKRFSAGKFTFPTFGGSCPLWNIHFAFEQPETVNTQVIRMPEGDTYFSMVKAVSRSGGTFKMPAMRLAVGLGCDISHANRLVYADHLSFDQKEPTLIGPNCGLCERPDCASRTQAPMNRRMAFNERERSVALFQFEAQ